MLWLEHPNLSIHNFNIPKGTSIDFLDTEYLTFCNSAITDHVMEQMTVLGILHLKIQNKEKFLKIVLLLSGNIELNPGSDQIHDIDASRDINRCGMH